MVDLRTLPVHALGAPSSSAHTSLLVPALLFRVLLRREGAGQDVLLQAVRDLRRAGVDSPWTQAELLQLPVDLTEFLNQQVRHEDNGDALQAPAELAHVIQCRLTGRVWGRSLRRPQHADTQYGDDGWPRRIVYGTVGQPIYERVFVVNAYPPQPPMPTATIVVGALQENERYAGATVLDQPRDVLVRVFVGVDAGNQPVLLEPVADAVDPDLTGRVSQLAARDPRLADWIVPPAELRRSTSSGLAGQLRRLKDLHGAIRGNRLSDVVGLDDLRHTAWVLLHAVVVQLKRRFPISRPPLSALERAHRVSAGIPPSMAAGFASRIASERAPSVLLTNACDALIGMSQAHHAAVEGAPDPGTLARLTLLIEDGEATLSAGLALPQLEANVRQLVEGLEQVCDSVIHLEVVRG